MKITFIMVRPQHPGNVGAAARSIVNFGFNDLRFVAPQCDPCSPEALTRAVAGKSLLESSKIYPDLISALHGCNLAFATSRRTGKRRKLHQISSISNLSKDLNSEDTLGLVFGSEEWGLTNEELVSCHQAITIPTSNDSDASGSLNLSHAVAIVAYQLRLCINEREANESASSSIGKNNDRPAAADLLNAMYEHLERSLDKIGFFPHGEPSPTMRQLKAMFGRAHPTEKELNILRGIASQIDWAEKERIK